MRPIDESDFIADDIGLMAIFGYPEYFSGTDGHIYSTVSGLRRLRACADGNGKYLYVTLCNNDGPKKLLVHRLVCESFHGPEKEREEVSHEDGNLRNNKPENLKWRTRKDNHALKKVHGTDDCGHKNSRAKLNKDQIILMKKHISEKTMTHEQIGKIFGVQRTFVSKVANGSRYARD